jgi:hypothetical protein
LIVYSPLAFATFANVRIAPASGWIEVDGDPDGSMWSFAWNA